MLFWDFLLQWPGVTRASDPQFLCGLEVCCYFRLKAWIRNAIVSHAAPSISCKVVSSVRYRVTRVSGSSPVAKKGGNALP